MKCGNPITNEGGGVRSGIIIAKSVGARHGVALGQEANRPVHSHGIPHNAEEMIDA